MTVSGQDEPYPTWFLVGLSAVAIGTLVIALFLWFRRPPGAGPIAAVPTTIATAEREPATLTARPALGAEGTATPVPRARRTADVGAIPSPTEELAASEPAQPAAAAAGATGTPAPRPPATPTPTPVATATAAVAMPTGEADVAEGAGTVEGQLALEGRDRFSGIALLVGSTPAATTDATGAFRLTLPAGRYTVQARYPGYMTIEVADVEVRAGDTTRLPAASLRAGDTDGDGDVDLFDIVRCVISLGMKAPLTTTHADVNGDGVIDFRDVILTQRNYRGTSPGPWQFSNQ